MKKIPSVFLLLSILFVQLTFAQQKVDDKIVDKIKAEETKNSQIMDTLGYITDVFGPRLTNSPNLKAAQIWTRDKMTSWGLNSQLESWGDWGKGWSVEKFSAEMFSPTYDRLAAYPLAWSPGTKGVISGNPIVVSVRSKADFDKYRGKLKGAIVMNGRFDLNKPESRFQTPSTRFTDEELAKAEKATDPAGAGINGGKTTTYWDEEKDWLAGLARRQQVIDFFRAEGVAALIEPSRFPNGVLLTQGFYNTDGAKNVPAFVMSREQYARIVRLADRNIPIKLELNLQTKFHDETTGYNVIAEIPGSDPKLKDEVVMLGGHFDSWHSGTGAIDNGAGCIVMMEALRILQAIGAKPRRTIRVALWSGEEEDYYGSMGYVKKHFGDPFTMQLKPEHEKLSAYFNLDNGSGKIRGIFLQGNEATRPIFVEYLKPFNETGAKTLSILNTGSTDHIPFDAVGLPGFEFIQDPIDYETRVHHSNLDVLEAVQPEDLKFNAIVVANFAYQTAMRDEKLPRKPLPKPQSN